MVNSNAVRGARMAERESEKKNLAASLPNFTGVLYQLMGQKRTKASRLPCKPRPARIKPDRS